MADEPQEVQDDAPGENAAALYPPFVTNQEQRRRWDLCAKMAENMYADLEESLRRTHVWSTTRALYSSDIPTDPPGVPTPVAPA